jgi:xanthine/uracil/vitamin C permease (AzgA family)
MANYPAQPPPQYYPPPPKQPGISTGVKIGIGIVIGLLLAMGGCVACRILLVGNTARQVQQVQQEREQSVAAAIQLLLFEDV